MSAEEIQHLADVRAAMRDNADYAEVNDGVKAGRYATALRQYMIAIPQTASRGSQGEELRFDMITLRDMLKKADDFLLRSRARANAGFRLRGLTRMRPRADDGDARRGSTP